MPSLLAIATLTCRAVWRLRAGWLLAIVIGLLLALPMGPGGAEVLILGILGPGQTVMVIAALWLAADLASREFDEQTILLLAVRPISHFRILVGRWLGLLACELPLLAMLVIGLVIRVGDGPAGWVTVRPALPDFTALAEQRLAEQDAFRGIRDAVARETVRREEIGELRALWQTVPPGVELPRRFDGLAAAQGELVLVLVVRAEEAGEAIDVALRLGPPGQPGPARRVQVISDAPCRIDLADLPPGAGSLEVGLRNLSDAAIVLPPDDGAVLTWRATGFYGNLARIWLAVAGQLAFLNAIGLVLGSLLSFPVAAFCGLGYLGAAGLIGLVAQRLRAPVVILGRQGLEQPWLERLSQLALHSGAWLTAPLNMSRPVANLAEGVVIPAADVWTIALGFGLLGAWLMLWLGGWLLQRREIGGLVA